MSTFAGAIQGLLGLKEWKKAEDKDILDADDVAKLKELGFDEKFITPFGEALKNGFKDEEQQAGPVENSGEALIRGLLAQKVSEMASLQEQLDAIRKTDGEKTQAITRKDTEIAELKQKISVLSALPEPDHGAGAGLKQNTGAGAFNLDDDKQLGGMQGEMFALDRPYNMRARAALLASQGINIQVRAESSVDYGPSEGGPWCVLPHPLAGPFAVIPDQAPQYREHLPGGERISGSGHSGQHLAG